MKSRKHLLSFKATEYANPEYKIHSKIYLDL